MLSSIKANQVSVISLGWSLNVFYFAYWSCLYPLVAAVALKATSVAPKLSAVKSCFHNVSYSMIPNSFSSAVILAVGLMTWA